jgi:miniconductance mechanosensitive channel
MKVFDLIEPVLKKLDFGADFTLYGNLFVNLLVLMVMAYAIDYLAKKILIIGLAIVATYTKSTFDDFLVANKTAKYIAHLVPLYYMILCIGKIYLAKALKFSSLYYHYLLFEVSLIH